MGKNKIIRERQYIDYALKSQDDIEYHNAVDIDISAQGYTAGIDKGISPYTEDLVNSRYDIELIDEYKSRIREQERVAKIEHERREEESRKIENPIDLSDVNTNMYMPMPERRVNFDRTFGMTGTRKKALKRKFHIIAYAVFTLSMILLASIYFRFR